MPGAGDKKGVGLLRRLCDGYILAHKDSAANDACQALRERLAPQGVMPEVPARGHILRMRTRSGTEGRVHGQQRGAVLVADPIEEVQKSDFRCGVERALSDAVIEMDGIRGRYRLRTRRLGDGQDADEHPPEESRENST